ncbi:TetR/AcrR family transcriptional regulator [Streptomyces sp. NBC_01257]|uniref:TetR/AcrR family transcriptional regulator n=1 Tax=Streptomyces sp. NBC_01257 TaxID=2903799 RepID=UPI002DDACD9F|nr:TetR/AcrR family transcriptional regulator [Streptomyces sp. NBC_01257]WRZ69187.1 TetR/AcrR family transcriptional regulator [Streptomyces sp. NBC_01257]
MSEPSSPPRRRRVQQRALDTRELLLRTAVQVLVDQGYAQFSTLAVGEAAGVSRGRLVHHFPTRLSLIEATLDYLADRYEARTPRHREIITDGPPGGRLVRALDVLWELKRTPEYQACLELMAGARGDAELRAMLRAFDRRLDETLNDAVRLLVGDVVDRPEFAASLLTAISAMRGLLVVARAEGAEPEELNARWRGVRDRLVLVFREFDPAH